MDERGYEKEPRLPYDDPHLEKDHNDYHHSEYALFSAPSKIISTSL